MQRITMQSHHMLALLFAGMLATGHALADKPEWAGRNKPEKQGQQRDRHSAPETDHDAPSGPHSHFGDRERKIAQDYFSVQYRAGRCPPGLTKKRNGCLPPGQAKKWAMGKPLPRDVVYYDLPSSIVVQLGAPPAGHRYVRVASDILLIAVGTGMVVDAIEDLGRM